MEVALLCGILNIILTKLISMAEEKFKLLHGMKDHMEFLEKELCAISSVVEEQLSSESNSLRPDQKIFIKDLSKLAYDIEDTIDSLMYHAVEHHHMPRKHRIIGHPRRQKTLLELAEELKRLKAKLAEDHERSNRYGALHNAMAKASSSNLWIQEAAYVDQPLPVGIDADVEELQKHLAPEEGNDQPKKLKVISIVGFRGSGKTVLAQALYNSKEAEQFFPRAWVCAAQLGAKEVLVEILHKLDGSHKFQDISDDIDYQHVVVRLREHLENKSYFIVIDDMRRDLWEAIGRALPLVGKFSSRIMVTTTVQSVATAINIGNANANVKVKVNVHVHKMGRLDKQNSEELFVTNACLDPKYYGNYGHPDSERILEKCDGQALALVTVGQFLKNKGWPTEESCNTVCRRFRHHLLEDEALERMRQVLMHSFASLPSHTPRTCLMHFAMFPSNRPIRRKILMRLWRAEGFVEAEPSCRPLDLAQDNFNTLIEHSIIEPVDVSNNSNVKTCKTYGMMREFILSMSDGFIALRGNESLETTPSHVRRLCFYDSSGNNDKILEQKFHLIRSLTIYGKASKAILEFSKYKLLRVLDLEGCTADLGDDDLKEICNRLCLLRYLSLSGTVRSLPTDIKKLRLLETLDLRKSNVTMLPKEVIELPYLIHLFGKFKLPSKLKTSKLEQSSLETLAGFIMDEGQAFDKIVCHMKNLSKVEIWCEGTTTSTNRAQFKKAIQQFIKDNMGSSDPRSLSVHCSEFSTEVLNDIPAKDCYLTSLKLEGMLTKLPMFVLSLRGLTELCLESCDGMATEVLTKLGNLKELKFLKLKADYLKEFNIKKGESFPKLRLLCLILKRPTLPSIIEDGALKYLVSLVVLCKKLGGPTCMRIQYLHSLTDISLDQEVVPPTKKEWESEANRHPRRPKILYVLNNDATASNKSTVGSVTSMLAECAITEYSAESDGPAQQSETQMLLSPGDGSSSSA